MSDLEEEYEVEKIVAQRTNNDVVEYKIRWKGYSGEYDTWEPEANLIGCEEVLIEFKIKNGMMDTGVKMEVDIEDGEVSGSDSSSTDSDDSRYRRLKKGNKKKRSKRKSSSKNSSKTSGQTIKTEHDYVPQSVAFNSDFGIKVEAAIDNQVKEVREKSKNQVFTPNFSLGASELLLNCQMFPMGPIETVQSISVKQEMQPQQQQPGEETVVVKEEMCSENNNIINSSINTIVQQGQPEESATQDESDFDEDDLDGQLKVCMGDDHVDKATDGDGIQPQQQPMDTSTETAESDKARSWREQLETGVFRIRKSQRKDDPIQSLATEEAPPILAKDKWPTLKPKDSQMEAFYCQTVAQSLADCRMTIDKEMRELVVSADGLIKESVKKSVEEGISCTPWLALNTGSLLNDGVLLLMAARLGFADIVGMVLRAGTNVNFKNDEGTTALMVACEHGHDLVCHLLIVNGAYLNVSNKRQETAITKAVTRGHKECLSLLLAFGCDVQNTDNDKSAFQISRQRNLHEMEAFIAEYVKKYTEALVGNFGNLLSGLVSIKYVIFPLRIVSLYEENNFTFEFNAKIPPVKDDECNMLCVYAGLVKSKQIRFCIDQRLTAQSVVLNSLKQVSLFSGGSNCITTMSPIVEGKNVLSIEFDSTINCRWIRILVIGFRVHISPNSKS